MELQAPQVSQVMQLKLEILDPKDHQDKEENP